MARKIYTHSKMQNLREVFTTMYQDMKAAGLTQVLPSAATPPVITAGAGKFIMDSSAACNPVNEGQPYRILVELEKAGTTAGNIKVAIATPQQIDSAGAVSKFPGPADLTGARTIGQLGKIWNKASNQTPGDVFITREGSNMVYDAGSVYSSIMVVTNRGIFYKMWVEGEVDGEKPVFSMFCVQTLVDKDTGEALVDDKSPIFCVFNCDNTGFKKYVVNESDIGRPTKAIEADKNLPFSNAIINTQEQVSIARGNKYLITLPNRLNTPRFAYSQEMDMFGYVSADVIGEGSEVSVELYGEDPEKPRVYRALVASGAGNSQVRLMVLVENGGVPVN